jgi:tetratricopeptide (TPR) repeat protein
MAKTGRNEPCPCGSGKKYKRCCLAKDEQTERAVSAAALTAAAASLHNHPGFCDDCYDEMAAASNAVLDLIDDGKLDEAERAARDLSERFPEVHDGYARLGLICEVRGENRRAIDYYRKVIAFAREHPDAYGPGFSDAYQDLIDRLEPAENMGALPPNPRDI